MSNNTSIAKVVDNETKASWLPLIIVMMCQIQLSFNAFNVSITGITQDLNIPATAVGTPLKMMLLLLAGMALLAVVPAGSMPGFQKGDLPVGYLPPEPPKTGKQRNKPAKAR